MRYTKLVSGVEIYTCLQDKPFSGCIALNDQQVELFLNHNGFVTITEDENGNVVVTPNTEDWESWKAAEAEKAAQPKEPSEIEDVSAMLVDQEYRLTLLELGVN